VHWRGRVSLSQPVRIGRRRRRRIPGKIRKEKREARLAGRRTSREESGRVGRRDSTAGRTPEEPAVKHV